MYEAKKERRQIRGGTSLAATSVLLSTILLAGCGSARGALESSEWGKGAAEPVSSAADGAAGVQIPQVTTTPLPDKESSPTAQAPSSADTACGQDAARRDAAPVRPSADDALTKPASTPAASPTQLAEKPVAPSDLPAVPAEPAVAVDNTSAASAAAAPIPLTPTAAAATPATVAKTAAAPVAAPAATASAASGPAPAAPVAPPSVPAAPAPSAPPVAAVAPQLAAPEPAPPVQPTPAALPVQPAPAAPLPEPVATLPAEPLTVEEIYRRRLAEFSATTAPAPRPAAPAAPTLVRPLSVLDASQTITLIPPTEYRRKLSHDNGGARPLATFDGSRSSASFQVGEISFGEGTAALAPADRKQLKEIVALYRQRHGSVRIFGRSASPRLDVDPTANLQANRNLAASRAAAIARALIRLGIPARKIYAGAAPGTGLVRPGSSEITEIYIDY